MALLLKMKLMKACQAGCKINTHSASACLICHIKQESCSDWIDAGRPADRNANGERAVLSGKDHRRA